MHSQTHTTESFDTENYGTSDIQIALTSCNYSCSLGSNQMQIGRDESGMAFAYAWRKYHSINHIKK